MRARRIATAAFATVFAVAGLAACAEDDGADNAKTEPKALADQAVAEMKKAQFISVAAKGKDEDGKDMVMDMCADITGKNLAGKGTMGGYAVEMIQVGDAQYMKAEPKFWASMTGNADDPALVAKFEKALGGKYIQSEADKEDSEVDFFEGDTNGVTKGEVTDFQGKKAVPLTKTDGGDKTTYYVAAKGKPVILGEREENKDGSTNEVAYTKSDKCEAKAPAKDLILTKDEVDAKMEEAAAG